MTKRTHWRSWDLGIKDEPLIKSLWQYRQRENRVQSDDANLGSSITDDGRHMPILDLDFPHHIVPSTTPGHSHLYFDQPIGKIQWLVLMTALRFAGLIETGFFVWSIRRGGNFVRIPGLPKDPSVSVKPTYGWFRKLKR